MFQIGFISRSAACAPVCTVGLAQTVGHLSCHHLLLHVDPFVFTTSVVAHTARPFITETNSVQWMISPACISLLHRAQCAFRSWGCRQVGGWRDGGGIGWRNKREGEEGNAQMLRVVLPPNSNPWWISCFHTVTDERLMEGMEERWREKVSVCEHKSNRGVKREAERREGTEEFCSRCWIGEWCRTPQCAFLTLLQYWCRNLCISLSTLMF